MKTIQSIVLILGVILLTACHKKEEKRYYADSGEKIKYYQDKGMELFKKGNEEALSQYLSDSIFALVKSSYIKDYQFTTVNGNIVNTKKIDKSIFLQVGGRGCAPCVAEIPALNDIVEKYHDQVSFILLNADSKEKLEKVKDEYHSKIQLVYLPKEENKDNTYKDPYSFSGFKHLVKATPINYLVSKDRKIVEMTGGGTVPGKSVDEQGNPITITKEMAYELNYKKLEADVKILLVEK